jgi:CBS domain-containing protein
MGHHKEADMTHTEIQPYHGSYLMPSLEHATVGDAMHPGISSCDPEATLADVARIMATHHVHCVVVMHPAQTPSGHPYVWGIVSDRDLVRAGIDPEADSAGDAARQPTITIEPTMALREAAELMVRNDVSHVVVVDDEERQRPIGVLSTLDLAGVLAWGEG